MHFNRDLILTKASILFFIAFSYFSSVFHYVSQVTILFHVSLILFIISIIFSKESKHQFFHDMEFNKNLLFPICFLIYYSITDLWSDRLGNIGSALTHSTYLIGFFLLYRQAERLGYKKYVLGGIFFGIVTLAIATLIMVDKSTLLTMRLSHAFPWAPSNVIDLGGYMVVGIYCGLMFIRETGRNWLYSLIILLFITFLLNQSRGPLIALVVSFLLIFSIKPKLEKKHLIVFSLLIVAIVSIFFLTRAHEVMLSRFEYFDKSTSVRFNIWGHALELIQENPFFGWGLDKSMHFKNIINEHITTTHSVYLSALLKGGVVGLLLMLAMFGNALTKLKKHLAMGQKAECSLLVFMMIFYLTQGMFVIGNPQHYWVLFWTPLIIVYSTPLKKEPEQAL